MKRELKFRAWQESQKKMHQEVGLHPHIMTNHTMCDEDECGYVPEGTGKGEYTLWTNEDTWPIMQYTGLKDRNGLEIYENDIVRDFECEYKDDTFTVYFVNGYWCPLVKVEDGYNCIDNYNKDRWAVIGNEFENPELI